MVRPQSDLKKNEIELRLHIFVFMFDVMIIIIIMIQHSYLPLSTLPLFFSFFLSWVAKPQLNHITKWVVRTQIMA